MLFNSVIYTNPNLTVRSSVGAADGGWGRLTRVRGHAEGVRHAVAGQTHLQRGRFQS